MAILQTWTLDQRRALIGPLFAIFIGFLTSIDGPWWKWLAACTAFAAGSAVGVLTRPSKNGRKVYKTNGSAVAATGGGAGLILVPILGEFAGLLYVLSIAIIVWMGWMFANGLRGLQAAKASQSGLESSASATSEEPPTTQP